ERWMNFKSLGCGPAPSRWGWLVCPTQVTAVLEQLQRIYHVFRAVELTPQASPKVATAEHGLSPGPQPPQHAARVLDAGIGADGLVHLADVSLEVSGQAGGPLDRHGVHGRPQVPQQLQDQGQAAAVAAELTPGASQMAGEVLGVQLGGVL